MAKHINCYELINTITKEVLGEESIVAEDLSNIVDIGDDILNRIGYDEYCEKIVNKIGKTIFVDRVYKSALPNILIDNVEYGSMIEKIWVDMPTASTNESRNLIDGASYDEHVFYKPSVTTKIFNKQETFEIDMSITDIQLKQSFKDATTLSAFVECVYTAINNAVAVGLENLCRRAVNNLIGETANDNNAVRYRNLLSEYNTITGETLTLAQAFTSKEFLRYCMKEINAVSDRLVKMSTLYNIAGAQRFTTKDNQTYIAHADFDRACKYNLLDATEQFRVDNLTMPKGEVVPYWQGSGTSYAFADTSKVQITTGSGTSVTATGVIAVLFDRNACGVAHLDMRTRTSYSNKAEFTNIYEKVETALINDLAENSIVFYIAE